MSREEIQPGSVVLRPEQVSYLRSLLAQVKDTSLEHEARRIAAWQVCGALDFNLNTRTQS